jgi:DNA sulfur modification protein DndD
LTEGRIQEILYEPEGRLSIIDAAQRTLPIERLSGGLYDLLMIALRLAMIERLENYGLPVVLDDPFGRLDSEHLTRMRELLIRFSQRNQVILLSRDPRFGAWGPTVLLGGGQQSMESNLDAAGLNAESGYGAV